MFLRRHISHEFVPMHIEKNEEREANNPPFFVLLGKSIDVKRKTKRTKKMLYDPLSFIFPYYST